MPDYEKFLRRGFSKDVRRKFPKKHDLELDSGPGSFLESDGKGNFTVSMAPNTPQRDEEEPPVLPSFDFMVIRYIWEISGGRDLDTRTALMRLSPSVDGIDVGWVRGDEVAGPSGIYLQWGGDNTSPAGRESALVNMNAILSDYPEIVRFDVRMRAFWFSSKGSGAIIVQAETFRGGEMVNVGTDWLNKGGERVEIRSSPRIITVEGGFDQNGQDLGFVQVDPIEWQFRIR